MVEYPRSLAQALVGSCVHLQGVRQTQPARRMQGRSDIRHPGNRACLRLDVVVRPESGLRVPPRPVIKDGGGFGQWPAVDQQRGHLAQRIDRQEPGSRVWPLANDSGRASKGTPISCSAMCTAIELEPGAK
jgi:hypothetical protein